MSFIGRENELERLQRMVRSPHAQIAAVYGRRRIGKSLLIEHVLKDRPPLIFEGLEDRPKRDQIHQFVGELKELTGHDAGRPRRWTQALMALFHAIKDDPRPIVLDEFQWMANYRHELVSELKYVWDRYLSKLPGQKLFLCGSIASFMIEKVVKSGALYGRIDTEIELLAFKLPQTRQMLPEKGVDEVLQAHLFTGGVPKYLDLLRPYPSVHLAIQELAFRWGGYFTQEYQRIFTSHFGKNPDFEALVRTLAAHPLGLLREALIAKAKVKPGGRLSEHLRDLASAGFISADTPFDRGEGSRHIKYFLSDAYLRFYFAFIQPHLKKIRAGSGSNILSGLSGNGALHAWMGRSFEYLCTQHALEISRLVGFSAVDFSMGPYFSPSRPDLPGVQVDLAFDRADNVITVCEAKYSSHPVGVEAISEMRRKIDLLAPVAQGKTFQPVLIVRDRPSQDLVDQAYFYKIIRASDFLHLPP